MGNDPETFYKYKSKYGGLEVLDVQKLNNWKRGIHNPKE
jgi:hypothetical protein